MARKRFISPPGFLVENIPLLIEPFTTDWDLAFGTMAAPTEGGRTRYPYVQRGSVVQLYRGMIKMQAAMVTKECEPETITAHGSSPVQFVDEYLAKYMALGYDFQLTFEPRRSDRDKPRCRLVRMADFAGPAVLAITECATDRSQSLECVATRWIGLGMVEKVETDPITTAL
ncbi:MAG: hypothetical protein Q7R83_03345 [bacterium]|nr:hypothetical protein [bacterium]